VEGTTTNRDFKVKHGLSVAEGGTFGQAVTVGTPTENTHAATKLYVDSKEVIVAQGNQHLVQRIHQMVNFLLIHKKQTFVLL
jgi:hypothetical protein